MGHRFAFTIAMLCVAQLVFWSPLAEAAISFVTSYGKSGTGTAAKVQPKNSAAVASGNVLLAQIVVQGGNCATLGTPSGWARLACDTSAGQMQAIFLRAAQPSDLNVTFNFSLGSSLNWASILLSYSGVDTINPVDAGPSTAFYTNSKNATAAAITTVTPGAMAVTLVSTNYTADKIFTAPSGFAERRERKCPGGGACSITSSDRTYATPATLSGITTTVKSVSSGIVHLLALRPYSLVAYYSLDGTPWTADQSGSGNAATAQGDASPVTARVCLGFNGTGAGWLTVPDNASLDMSTQYSVDAWVYPTAYPASGQFKTIVAKGTNYALHIQSDGRLYWSYQYSGGTRVTLSTSVISLNQWTHVAVVFDRTAGSNRQRIYINGVLDATSNYADTPLVNSTSLYIGSDAGYTSGATNRNFIGLIDEVRIYNGAITSSQVSQDMAATHACGVDHYRLALDGQGLTCQPEPVTVTACANATCDTVYSGTASVTLAATASATVSPNPVSMIGGAGGTNVSKGSAGITALSITAASPLPAGTTSYRCFVGGVEVAWANCQINFQAARLVLDIPDIAACTGTGDATLLAEGCSGTISGSQSLKLWMGYVDPNTANGEALKVGTLVVPAAKPAANNLTLTFDANGLAALPLVNYDDAGDLAVYAEMTAGGTTMSGELAFASVPDRLELAPVDAAAICGDTINPYLCAKYKRAGESFNMELRALCSTGKVTRNFRQTGIGLSSFLQAPSGGNPGTFAPPSVDMVAADNGDKTFAASISEVGVFSFKPQDVSYKGAVVPGVETPWLGRFFPHHFDTLTANACDPFTYSGAPFPLKVTARNASGEATANYAGNFAKLVSFTDANGAAGSFNTLGADKFVAGVADAGLDGNPLRPPSVSFSFTSKLTAPALVMVRANDTDTVNAVGASEGTILVRSGRIRLSNAHGSERLALNVPVRAEYYNGTLFVANADDSCTNYTLATDLSLGNYQRNLNAGETTPSPATIALASGVAAITMSAPGVGNSGSVDLTLALPTWLQFNWTGAVGNPKGRATFGIYNSAKELIYLRESY